MSQDPIILRAEAVTKVYPGTLALDKVDFNIRRGKVNVLIGENGAGKSTLMKILSGVEESTSGKLLLEGKEITLKSPRDATRQGIGIIYQELNLFPNLSVSENIFMGREKLSNFGVIDHKAQETIAQGLLKRTQQPISPKSLVADLRIGQQQIVEIAKALAQNAQILIMDEPTSALSQHEVESLFSIIQDLTAQGVSIVYISHKLDELLRIGDFFTILRDGRLVAEAPAAEVSLEWIVEKMVGRSSDSLFHREEHEAKEVLLEVSHLNLPRAGGGMLLDDVSFKLRAGEVLGIYGLMGSGRTELLESLMGLQPQASAAIKLAGKAVSGDIKTRIRSGLALVPEDRQRMGLVQVLSVAKNMTLSSLKRFVRGLALSDTQEKKGVEQMIKELSVKVADPAQLITSLSGGNQQKVVVAKSLLTEPKVLLLDEPTRGIDVAAKGEMFSIMNELSKKGLGMIFVSSELKEIMAMADRVLVLAKGRISADLARADLSEQALVAASAGETVRLAA
ncbi:MAG: sugar ABC transporter ATP-binding protein [Trueperaceae bacterium]|nr:sugar ABC transporter ATP-binding protein [Trueperaceae bacterium]